MGVPSLLVIGLYFALLLGIGIHFSRRVRSEADFFIAGKGLGYWVVSFSARATGESGWLLLGLTGLGWAVGLNAMWVVFGEVLGVTVSWLLVVRRFKVFTDRYGSITVPDYLESRFRDTSHLIRWIASTVLVVMVTAYIAAQLTATGKAFRDFLGMEFEWGAFLGLLIVLFYTTMGGFFAVAWSDLVQGLLMLAGLILVPVAAIVQAGGVGSVIASLSEQDPALLAVFGREGFTLPGIATAAGFVAVGLAFLGSPQLYTRFMAIRNKEELVNGSLVAVIFTILTDTGAVLTGMAGRALFRTLHDQEAIFPLLSGSLFPSFLTALLVAVVLAAIMSTADSLLLLASSACVRDIYHRILRPKASEKSLLTLSRWVTFSLSIGALLLALREQLRPGAQGLVYWLSLFAWAGIASAFCPPLLLSLFWKRTTRWGVVAGMVSGFATAVLWKLCVRPALLDIYEMIPAFGVSFLLTFLVSRLTKPPPEADADFSNVKKSLQDSPWRGLS